MSEMRPALAERIDESVKEMFRWRNVLMKVEIVLQSFDLEFEACLGFCTQNHESRARILCTF